VILPIRQARSHLNAEPLRSQQAVLRKQLLQSELQAEQEAIRLIFTWLQQQTLTEQADCSAVNLTLLQNITMADNGSVTAQKKEARGPLLQQLLLLAK